MKLKIASLLTAAGLALGIGLGPATAQPPGLPPGVPPEAAVPVTTPQFAADTARFWFTHFLGREPNREELNGAIQQIRGGANLIEYEVWLMSTPEFIQRWGNRPEDLTYGLFSTVLLREPMKEEVIRFTAPLARGDINKTDFIRSFVNNAQPELTKRLAEKLAGR